MDAQILPASEVLSVVVVGLGHIAAKHAVVLAKHPRLRIVATVDPLLAKRTGSFVGLSDDVIHGTDLGAVLNMLDGQVEAKQRLVLVATPNGTHISLARVAVECGWHVLIEKPMGLDPVGCVKLVDIARRRGHVLAVAMQNRFGWAARTLKSMVDLGRLGELRMVQIECFWNRDEKYYNASKWRGTRDLDGGVLFTQFSHFIDLLLWLLGRPEDFSLLASNQAHPGLELDHDTGVLSMRWSTGMLGTMAYTTAAPPGRAVSGFTLWGSEAGVRLTGQYMDRLEWFSPGGALLPESEFPVLMGAAVLPGSPGSLGSPGAQGSPVSPISGSSVDLSPSDSMSRAGVPHGYTPGIPPGNKLGNTHGVPHGNPPVVLPGETPSKPPGDPPNTQYLMWDHLCGVILDQQPLLLPPEEAMEVVRFIHDIHQIHMGHSSV